MHEAIYEKLIANSLAKHKLDNTKEGLKTFLRSPDFLKYRCTQGGRFIGPSGGEYLHRSIYHRYLSDEDKIVIYDSGYELGSIEPIPCESEKDFFSYLNEKYGGEDTEGNVKDIKKMITALTGVQFKLYLAQDKSLAYKVITLFYRIMKQYNSKIISFLMKPFSGKAEFEYRAEYPLITVDRAIDNSSILDEILTYLTFSMPQEYFEVANSLSITIAEVGEDMASMIKRMVHSDFIESDFIAPDLKSDINTFNSLWAQKIKDKAYQGGERLDFSLYAALILRVAEFRNKSCQVVAKTAYETPLKLNPISLSRAESISDDEVIESILGHSSFKSGIELQRKTKFIQDIIEIQNRKEGLRLSRLQVLLIKAVIIHDMAKPLEIKSKVIGESSVQKSVKSVLRDVAKQTVSPNSNKYPEALVQYWVFRFQLATYLLAYPDNEKKQNSLRKRNELEMFSDAYLNQYLKHSQLVTFKTLKFFPITFEKSMRGVSASLSGT
ncbi:hypothetical protein [Pseudoalteromonas byunsanensis]|uniref:Uncharacterized protein n=1 Tax=Pseudoalteromonas byunsanensis TaxID=327939 RepID=A0A1S1NFE0_9GAMM|nr:hypothetical protein [Pseudoalteromonas byunsanensis]OHU97559.1 hypothetical protein BIW53_01995 [Pseudoalteromonas byunsanensis]